MINKVIVIGRLARTPELRTSTSGYNYTFMTLAVSRKLANGEEDTDWLEYIAYGKVAETICKYLEKGLRVLVEGSLRSSIVTKSDGTKIYDTKIEVKNIEFLERKKQEQ